ncbi:DUF2834 domain-containing protein [Bdellovibrio sp. HCB209]|uniref:DUF2834 domain-containing protein n=1 Tax=Bdellovibrio sp. HCB209 TaxID=3394354 RepID=UPI0039B58CBC
MRTIWLFLAILGTVVPYYFFLPFLMNQGLDLSLMMDLLFANSVSRFFAVDLIISSIAFLLWSYGDSKKNNVTGWCFVLVANLTVGLSLALPLYFFKRHSAEK